MTDQIQPPPGYTSEPPSEPGWYRCWNEIAGYGVMAVRGPDSYPGLYVWGDDGKFPVDEVDGYWGSKIEFP